MRLFLPIFLLFFTNVLFAQDSATLKEINKLVGPKFHFDTATQHYGFDLYLKDEVNDNFIINVHDTGFDKSNEFNKIFVLKKANSHLCIIDSSSTFERDGGGPNLSVHDDTITLQHSCSDCNFEYKYKFDKTSERFVLVTLSYSELIMDKYPRNDVAIGRKLQLYNVKEKLLTIDSLIWKKQQNKIINKRTIKKALPKSFVTELSNFIDPFGEKDYGKISNKIFEIE